MALIEFLGVSKRKLAAIWDKLGIIGEARKDRENVMLMHVRNLVAEMVDEEEKLTKRVQANILKFKRLILQMSMELNIETPEVRYFKDFTSMFLKVLFYFVYIHSSVFKFPNPYQVNIRKSIQ